jgi:hypothetical protein
MISGIRANSLSLRNIMCQKTRIASIDLRNTPLSVAQFIFLKAINIPSNIFSLAKHSKSGYNITM